MAKETPIGRLRSHLGFSQADLAERLGVTRGHVSHLENGVVQPGPDFLMRLLDCFRGPMQAAGVELEDVLRGRFRHAGRRGRAA